MALWSHRWMSTRHASPTRDKGANYRSAVTTRWSSGLTTPHLVAQLCWEHENTRLGIKTISLILWWQAVGTHGWLGHVWWAEISKRWPFAPPSFPLRQLVRRLLLLPFSIRILVSGSQCNHLWDCLPSDETQQTKSRATKYRKWKKHVRKPSRYVQNQFKRYLSSPTTFQNNRLITDFSPPTYPIIHTHPFELQMPSTYRCTLKASEAKTNTAHDVSYWWMSLWSVFKSTLMWMYYNLCH